LSISQRERIQIFKKFIFTVVFALLVGFLAPGLNALANELNSDSKDETLEIDYSQYEVSNEEISKEDYFLLLDDTDVELDNSDLSLVEQEEIESLLLDKSEEPLIRPMIAPLVVAVVVRIVISYAGKQAVKKISKHAVQRATERGISSKAMATAMSYGTKYVDKNTGAKILWHQQNKVALVLDKSGKTVVTTYKQNKAKAVWKKKKW
jgi:hypothetical protein